MVLHRIDDLEIMMKSMKCGVMVLHRIDDLEKQSDAHQS